MTSNHTLIPVQFPEKEIAEELEALLRAEPSTDSPTTPQNITSLVDTTAADNSSIKSQEEWINYFNSQRKVMASLPDLYHAGKSGSPDLLVSLRKDFKDSWEISSTRIIYNANGLTARIIHYFGSTITTPVESPSLIVPIYRGTPLNDVLAAREGLIYLQTLFRTADDSQAVRNTLQKLSNYSLEKTKVWTADDSSRVSHPARAAGFYCNLSGFHVDGNSSISPHGRSRGVKVGPR